MTDDILRIVEMRIYSGIIRIETGIIEVVGEMRIIEVVGKTGGRLATACV